MDLVTFARRIAVPQGGSFTVSTLGALSTGCTRADTAVRPLKLDHIEVVSKTKLAREGGRGGTFAGRLVLHLYSVVKCHETW